MNQNNEENNNLEQNTELEFNRKNRENYETLMSESSTQLDGYWDSNNPIVKILLLCLGGIIIIGVLYYLFVFLGSK